MSPRKRYETALHLLDEYDRTGNPDLLDQAEALVGTAEHHLATCPNAALEVPHV